MGRIGACWGALLAAGSVRTAQARPGAHVHIYIGTFTCKTNRFDTARLHCGPVAMARTPHACHVGGPGVVLVFCWAALSASAADAAEAAQKPLPPPLPPRRATEGACRFINASTTDPAIRDWQLPRKAAMIHTSHWVCSHSPGPTVAARSDELPPLLLFIPGTGLAPQDYKLFPRHAAASLGLPSIGLAYPSNMAATSACMATPDQRCYEGYHEALLEYRGQAFDLQFKWHGSGPDATLAPRDTIAHRLVALLQFLHKTEPTQHWDRFLAANTSLASGAAAIEWSKVIVAGHSQGACHVGWISKRFLLRRAIMFSGTNDIKGSKHGFPGPSAALYLHKPGVTPAGRIFGFGELNGGECTTWRPLWDVLNMSGAFLVDRAGSALPPPVGSVAHMLCSARCPAEGGVHGGPVQDIATPLDRHGIPIYTAVWSYLLDTRANVSVASSVPPNTSNCDCLHPLPPLPPPPALPPPRAVGVIYSNWSTMSGKCRGPRLNGTMCQFVGVMSSAADCAAECRDGAANCTSWTWHGMQQTGWSGQCYTISDGTWAPVRKVGDFCGWKSDDSVLRSMAFPTSQRYSVAFHDSRLNLGTLAHPDHKLLNGCFRTIAQPLCN
eukprot:SAG31_NODE_758_length_12292_cov_14.175511_4_plen_610_part_00